MTRRPLRPEERSIWARIAGSVTPRPGRRIPALEADAEPGAGRPGPKPMLAAPRLADFLVVRPSRQPGPPQERSGEKRVRRGRVDVDGRLDLHGMTQVEAHAALSAFLRRLQASGGRCGLVITGKGRAQGGEGAGVLRRRLPEWLAEPALAAMSAGYAPAHARHGGDGAWYVFVKKRA